MRLLVVADHYAREDIEQLRALAARYTFAAILTLGDLPWYLFDDLAQLFPETPRLAVMGNHDVTVDIPTR